jgi:hypothetical protein
LLAKCDGPSETCELAGRAILGIDLVLQEDNEKKHH